MGSDAPDGRYEVGIELAKKHFHVGVSRAGVVAWAWCVFSTDYAAGSGADPLEQSGANIYIGGNRVFSQTMERSMAPVPPDFVIGVNFSSDFQSTPINPAAAATQLAPLVRMAKTFSLTQRSIGFMAEARNRGLRLCVGTPNDMLQDFANGNTQTLISAITPYVDDICWVCVGNEPLGSWNHGKYNNILAPATQNVLAALRANNWTQIGVTIPQNFEIMDSSYPPSSGAIKSELIPIISATAKLMQDSGAPFMINIYPFITRMQNPNIPLDYCNFQNTGDHSVYDPPYTYQNIFDAMIDALYVGLGRIGLSSLEIVIGECGWPTAGDPDATPDYARIFVQNLITHCRSGVGTPRMPNRKIRCFVFEAYDEDLKDPGPGPFETHWGVFDGSGNPKFPLNWLPSP